MTNPIVLYLACNRLRPSVDITDAIAAQIVGLTDLPARIAALEQKASHWHLMPSPPDGDGLPTSLPVSAPWSEQIDVGPPHPQKDKLQCADCGREYKTYRGAVMCAHRDGIPDSEKTWTPDQPTGDDAAGQYMYNLMVQTLAFGHDAADRAADAILAAVRRGDVPGIVTQQWADYQLVGATCKKYEDEIVALRAKLAEAEARCAELADLITAAVAASDGRDAARADADALAGLLRECKRYVPWSLESSIDAALAKHGGSK